MPKLESHAPPAAEQPFTVWVATMAPFQLKLVKPIPVLIRRTGDEYLASFVEATTSSSGETVAEAVFNLKDILSSLFMHYRSLPPEKLGIGPTRQLAVMREVIEA